MPIQPAHRIGDLTDLPPTLTIEAAARLLGIGRTLAYDLARRDDFPCRVLRLGTRYVIPTTDLLHLLRIPTDDEHGPASTSG